MYYQFSKQSKYIKLSEILNKPDVIAQLPRELQCKEKRPVITYKLTNTIRNKILITKILSIRYMLRTKFHLLKH